MTAKALRQQPIQHYVMEVLRVLGALLIIFFVIFPIFWLFLTSLKNEGDTWSSSLNFMPTLSNFSQLFDGNPYDFGRMLLNTFIVSVVSALFSVPIATMAAFAFSRYRFIGKDLLLVAVLASQFLPGVVVLIPFFILFRDLQLLDTLTALIIMHLSGGIPFGIWMLKGFIDSLPVEIEEAAVVDGASEFGVLRHITGPLIMPGIVTVTVLSFIGSWNEFMFAFILTKTDAARPMMVGIMSLSGIRGTPWNLMAAASLILMVPVFILSLSIRRYFIQGLTMGAVK